MAEGHRQRFLWSQRVSVDSRFRIVFGTHRVSLSGFFNVMGGNDDRPAVVGTQSHQVVPDAAKKKKIIKNKDGITNENVRKTNGNFQGKTKRPKWHILHWQQGPREFSIARGLTGFPPQIGFLFISFFLYFLNDDSPHFVPSRSFYVNILRP